MRRRITKLIASSAALTVLAFGGATLASAGSKPSTATKAAAVPHRVVRSSATDGDQLQQGDQTTPDTAAGEQPGAEQASAAEQTDTSAAEATSEQTTNDGPGGHADEPGNATADHQFQGQE